MHHREIIILVSNQRAIMPQLTNELAGVGIPFENPREEGFLDSLAGRLALALLRVVCDDEDYVSLRAILYLRKGVGIGSCHDICDNVIANNLNFRNIIYNPDRHGFWGGRL